MLGNRFWIIALVLIVLGLTGTFIFEEQIFPRARLGSSSPEIPRQPAKPDSFQKALVLFQGNRLPEAESEAKAAIDQGGDVYASRNLLGLILIESNRNDEAIALFQANANAQPGNPMAYSNAGEAFRRLSEPTEALVPLQRAVELAPNEDFYRFKLHMAQIECGKNTDLVVQTGKELKKGSPSADWLMTAAAIALSRQNWKEASIIFKDVEKIIPPNILSEFLKDPLFKTYANQKEASGTFPKVVLTPPPGPITQEALQALGRKDYVKSLELLAGAQKSGEPPCYIHTIKGAIFMSQRKFSEAVPEFQNAAIQSPWDPKSLMNLGQALRANERPVEAVIAFQKALVLEPKNELYAVKMAFALIESGQAKQVLAMNGSGPLLIAKAAAAAHQNDIKSALENLKTAQATLPPEMLASLLQDPVFSAYRKESRLAAFFPSVPLS